MCVSVCVLCGKFGEAFDGWVGGAASTPRSGRRMSQVVRDCAG